MPRAQSKFTPISTTRLRRGAQASGGLLSMVFQTNKRFFLQVDKKGIKRQVNEWIPVFGAIGTRYVQQFATKRLTFMERTFGPGWRTWYLERNLYFEKPERQPTQFYGKSYTRSVRLHAGAPYTMLQELGGTLVAKGNKRIAVLDKKAALVFNRRPPSADELLKRTGFFRKGNTIYSKRTHGVRRWKHGTEKRPIPIYRLVNSVVIRPKYFIRDGMEEARQHILKIIRSDKFLRQFMGSTFLVMSGKGQATSAMGMNNVEYIPSTDVSRSGLSELASSSLSEVRGSLLGHGGDILR